jgi:hypothetical protein
MQNCKERIWTPHLFVRKASGEVQDTDPMHLEFSMANLVLTSTKVETARNIGLLMPNEPKPTSTKPGLGCSAF